MNRLSYKLPAELDAALERTLNDWQQDENTARLWERDASLWTDGDEADWLGWLTVVQQSLAQLDGIQLVVEDLVAADISHVVLLGMGGSSMAPEVIQATFGRQPGFPSLIVLDSTDPAQILAVDAVIDLERTAFIVASKSGTSLEPTILMAWFLQRMVAAVGEDQAAGHFIAITDPGTRLEETAIESRFMSVFHGEPDIGGRFSALSHFGVVPAAIIGVDCRQLLESTQKMVTACETITPVHDNPGVLLGCILSVATKAGRDKLTIVAAPQVDSFGAWLEQLIAESTGKRGRGIIPVDGEPLATPASYGDDRLFVYLCMDGIPDPDQEEAIATLEQAGQPVIRIHIAAADALGQEFFRWEIATAVTGALLHVHPFDQPDVEASKIETRKLMASYETGEDFSEDLPLVGDSILSFFTDEQNRAELLAGCGENVTVQTILAAHLARLKAGDYVAFLAYLARNGATTRQIQMMRAQIRDTHKVATCLGFGPRFLHSTGQCYKGGPDSGVFLQLTCDVASDLPVPGHHYSFGVVQAAQARGDFDVLAMRGRRVLRVHMGTDVAAGLERLELLLTTIA